MWRALIQAALSTYVNFAHTNDLEESDVVLIAASISAMALAQLKSLEVVGDNKIGEILAQVHSQALAPAPPLAHVFRQK